MTSEASVINISEADTRAAADESTRCSKPRCSRPSGSFVGQDLMIERLLRLLARRAGTACSKARPGWPRRSRRRRVAKVLGGTFARLQFTPDLCLPTSSAPASTARRSEAFDVELGPVFANVVLADEINRAPAKVQSALLEVMAERHVSIGGDDVRGARSVPRAGHAEPDRERGRLPAARSAARPLPDEGPGRLPDRREEARDRPAYERRTRRRPSARPRDELDALQAAADDVFVHDAVLDYAVRLVLATREPAEHDLAELGPLIAHGASPRALARPRRRGACARAPARPPLPRCPRTSTTSRRDVLRHRVLLSYEALADGIDAEEIVERIVRTVVAPESRPRQDDTARGRIAS